MKRITAIKGLLLMIAAISGTAQSTFSVFWEEENKALSLHGFIWEQDTIRILQRSSRSNQEIFNTIDFDADGLMIKHDTILVNPLWNPWGYNYRALTKKAFRRFNYDPIIFWTRIFIDDASQITAIPRFGIIDRESDEFRMSKVYYDYNNNSLEDLQPWNDTLLLLLIKAEQNDHTKLNLSLYNTVTMFLERIPVYIAKEQKSLIPSQFIVTSDQEIMITGFSRTSDYESIFVMKLNDQLEEIWYKEFLSVSHYGGINPSILVDRNGDIIVAAGTMELGEIHTQKYLLRLSDEDGRLLDEKILPNPGHAAFSDNLILLDDGAFIATGFTEKYDQLADTILRYATLSRINRQFEIEWERRFDPLPGKSCEIGYLDQSPDGGFVASGKIFQAGTAGNSFPWLVKMDHNGCVVAGCDSLALISNTRDLLVSDIALKVFPNPVGSEITLQLENIEINDDAIVSVLDIQGNRIIATRLRTNADNMMRMDLSSIRPGLYLVELNTNGLKSIARFVKN